MYSGEGTGHWWLPKADKGNAIPKKYKKYDIDDW